MGMTNIIETLQKYITIEVIVIIVVVCICLYFYFKYDRHRIKIDLEDVSYTPLFLDSFQTLKKLPVRKHKKKKKGGKGTYKHEEMCREIFEKLYSRKFPSVRPDFLKNPVTGHNLELDGYCESLKLAFEYDGGQHSKYTPRFHRHGAQEFIYQVKKDDFKTKKCKLEGIDLIRIPHYIHASGLEDYIKRELKRINRL